MYTDEHELKDLLARKDIDKKKLYEGLLNASISCFFIDHSYRRNKGGNLEYKKDVFQVRLDVNDYLLTNQEDKGSESQQNYSVVLRVMMNEECRKLYKVLTKNITVNRAEWICDSFSGNKGKRKLREMGTRI